MELVAALIVVIAILFLMAHAGYNYIPVAYEGANFMQDMQAAARGASQRMDLGQEARCEPGIDRSRGIDRADDAGTAGGGGAVAPTGA